MTPRPQPARPAPSPDHVIWDWNGTLLDDTRACVNALNVLLRERGLPPTDETSYRARFGFPVRGFYTALGFRLEHEDWDALAARFHALYLAQADVSVPLPARKALAWLGTRGIGQSVLSACEQGILDTLIARHGLTGTFAHVRGTDNLDGHSKLDAGHALFADIGLPAARLLLIGDTLHDAEVAAELDCGCLLVAGGHQSHARLQAAGRPVLDSLDELPAWWNARTTSSPGSSANGSHPAP